MDRKCEALTLKGNQCKKAGTYTVGGARYCTQHHEKHIKDSDAVIVTIRDTEPWEKNRLPTPSPENGRRVLQKIRRRIKAGPSPKDTAPGCIYIYYLEEEADLNYWKIGRTSRTADERLKEWAAEHKKAKIKLAKQYKVQGHANFIETLIHLYLHYARMYRTPYGDDGHFHSVWASTGEIIQDGQETTTERVVAMRKHIEWFCMPFEDVVAVVGALVNAYRK